MILEKYQDTYTKFITKYEEIHVNPWHNITKEKLNEIYQELITTMDINDKYTFIYFMNYIIKRLSGTSDAHTKLCINLPYYFLPLYFRVIENEVITMYPSSLKNWLLESINGIPIKVVLKELDDVITYGTEGKKKYELEKSLFNSAILYGLPSLRNSNQLTFKINLNNQEITKTFIKEEKIPNQEKFDFYNYSFKDNASYRIIDNCLVYNHRSAQPFFENDIKNSILELEQLDLTQIDKFIIDLRGNFGGNASLNRYLIDFLKRHNDKKLYVLTDYRIFSGGRYALIDLIKLGAITIGDEISTPINCYGNSHHELINKYWQFSISNSYLDPLNNIDIKSKEQFNKLASLEYKPIIFKPDTYILETLESFINDTEQRTWYSTKPRNNLLIKIISILKTYLKKEQYDIMNMRVKWRNKNW